MPTTAPRDLRDLQRYGGQTHAPMLRQDNFQRRALDLGACEDLLEGRRFHQAKADLSKRYAIR